ncbi:acyltransferase [Methylobacterium sp. ARG-1]|uniref:acyltransferase n=1 Tax=Methylobacterium sp. ARG-1 TaxID=1692501 RepID=UPI001FCE28E0|nr:acyltransferase [Methylobacterium sp. ARG-1]
MGRHDADLAEPSMPLNIVDKGDNNVIDIDSRDQHAQAGKIYINGDNNYIRIGRGCVSDKDMHIVIESNCKFDIGEDVRLGMANIYIGPGSMLRIGDRTGFTGLVHLNPVEAKVIEIGSDCSIASGVWMTTSDFHSIISRTGGERLNPAKPVRVGNHVWIANQATLLKGSTIGDNAIIGAHAVVTGLVPANCVAAGNPARIVREDVTWRSDLI